MYHLRLNFLDVHCHDEGMTWQAIPIAGKVPVMKKQIVITISLILLSGKFSGAMDQEPSRMIIATFYPIRLALMNLVAGVDGVGVGSLANSESGCLHDYQLTTRDMTLLSKSSLLVVNGAGLESFLDDLVRSRPGLKVLNTSTGINLLVSGGITNAHVWVSPARHIQQVRNMAEGLAAWDPDHAVLYRRNGAAYIARLEGLKKMMDSVLQGIRKREIITFHEAFPYFADDFNLKVVGIIEREPGASPSAAEMVSLIQLVRSSKVKALFVEPQYPAKVASVIAQETGASVFVLDPVVSGPESTNAYINIMKRNLSELEQALR